MKAEKITMQIVKNLGNYEMCRLEATYTLTEMEANNIEDAFVNARGQLERAFRKAYDKTEAERADKGSIEKMELTDKKQINRVLKAVKDGKLSVDDVREQFKITSELKAFFALNNIEL